MSNFWIGLLNDGRLLLYDYEIPQNDQGKVTLFDFSSKSINTFPRFQTRKNTETIDDNKIIDEVVQSYLDYKNSLSIDNNDPSRDIHQQRIFEPEPDIDEDVIIIEDLEASNIDSSMKYSNDQNDTESEGAKKIGIYIRPNLKTPDYEYSDDDFDGLESDDYMDDYVID